MKNTQQILLEIEPVQKTRFENVLTKRTNWVLIRPTALFRLKTASSN